jgi:hypothetical protein
MYVHPLGNPVRFAHAVVERGPLLLFGQWVFAPEIAMLFSREARHLLWMVALAVAAILTALLLPLLRRDPVARFFASGMLLSLIPACGTTPHNRLLLLAGVGGSGLLAQFLGGMAWGASWRPQRRAWLWPATAAAIVLGLVHLVVAPIGLERATANTRAFGRVVDRAAASLPAQRGIEQRLVFIVHTPTAFVSMLSPLLQATWGRPVPRSTVILGSTIHGVTISRPDDRTLRIRPKGGYLLPAGSSPDGDGGSMPAFDQRYAFPGFDLLYRDSPMERGTRVSTAGIEVEVTEVTADGRPAESEFVFDRPLDAPAFEWVRWENGEYVRFALPEIGEVVELAPLEISFLPPHG